MATTDLIEIGFPEMRYDITMPLFEGKVVIEGSFGLCDFNLGYFLVVYLRERLKEQLERWGDPWKYGMKTNKKTIDTFIRYNYEQGMIKAPLPYEKIFAGTTLDT